jgi:acyl carrier protein
LDLKDRIKTFIAAELIGQPSLVIGNDEDLLLTGLVDSLGVVRLIAYIEDDLGVTIPPGEITIENFGTVNAIGTYLGSKLPT